MEWRTFSLPESIRTDRLNIRVPRDSDAESFFVLRNQANVNRYIDRQPPSNIRETREWLKKTMLGIHDGSSLYWTISLDEGGSVIGTICLWNFNEAGDTAEVGFELMEEYWRKGYGSEALRAILDLGHTLLKLREVEAYAQARNTASRKLLERQGFRLQSIVEEKSRESEKLLEQAIYQLEL